MDRGALDQWGLDLADEAFAQALAALGAIAVLPSTQLAPAWTKSGWHSGALSNLIANIAVGSAGVLPWRLPAVVSGTTVPRVAVTSAGSRRIVNAPPAQVLIAVWREAVTRLPHANATNWQGLRLAVQSKPATSGQTLALMAWLTRHEVGAASVYLADAFTADGRTDWHWPFTIATLPDDPLAGTLALLQQEFPPTWPYHFGIASRDQPRVEVLLISAGASDALGRVLASGLRLRCCLVLVAGLGADSAGTAEPLLRALAARVSAEGLAVLEPDGSPHEFAQRLMQAANELTHNKTIDVALTQAFRPGVLLLLNRDLLSLSRLDTTVARVTQRLRRLPPKTEVKLSTRSFERLGLPHIAMRSVSVSRSARAQPPEPAGAAMSVDLADAIDAAKISFRFDSESGEAAAVSELSRSLGDAQARAERDEPMPRYLQQKSFRKLAEEFVEERVGYSVGQPVMVQVWIGPKRDDSIAAPGIFPEDKLPKSRRAHRLQVVFHEPRQFDQPLLAEILLPPRRDRNSSVASFVFTPRTPGKFEGRMTVLHRGRVLQTVLLHTQVVLSQKIPSQSKSGITLDDETQVHHDWSDLGKRRQFDMAVVLNHSHTGEPLLTGVVGQRAWATNLQSIEQPVRKINDLISAVALSVADYGDGLDQGENPALLVKLARVGANLYSLLYRDQFKRFATDGFDVGDESVTYLQVVSARLDAVVPLEFMYDFNAPDPDATVCPQHRQALETGRCPGNCARATKPRAYMCPMGFWGLKKVIERHMFDNQAVTTPESAVAIQAEALEGRDQLDLSAGALIGHSQEVDNAEVAALVTLLSAKMGSMVPVVKDWDEWLATVRATHPAMLVAFPHNEGKEEDVLLEIGGDKLYTLDLPADYVHQPQHPPPLVFLLGCDVAGTAQDYSSHIRFFRQAGAAVVVCTIATVFGAHAVRVGEAIVARLIQPGEPGKLRIGEVIRDAKRAALLESVPMALCVVAFGDADWRLS